MNLLMQVALWIAIAAFPLSYGFSLWAGRSSASVDDYGAVIGMIPIFAFLEIIAGIVFAVGVIVRFL